jgi:hypothetical protein
MRNGKGIYMKRDMELVRTLLLKIEAAPNKPSWKELTAGESEAQAHRTLAHLKLIEDAGLTKSLATHMAGDRLPHDIDLTWEGHEFLDDTRDPDVWQKAKERTKGLASVGIGFIWEIAKAEVKTKLGLP